MHYTIVMKYHHSTMQTTSKIRNQAHNHISLPLQMPLNESSCFSNTHKSLSFMTDTDGHHSYHKLRCQTGFVQLVYLLNQIHSLPLQRKNTSHIFSYTWIHHHEPWHFWHVLSKVKTWNDILINYNGINSTFLNEKNQVYVMFFIPLLVHFSN